MQRRGRNSALFGQRLEQRTRTRLFGVIQRAQIVVLLDLVIDRKVVDTLLAIEENISILFFEDRHPLTFKLSEYNRKLGLEIRTVLERCVTEQASLQSIVFV